MSIFTHSTIFELLIMLLVTDQWNVPLNNFSSFVHAYLPRYSPVVGAALPEPAAEAPDEADLLLLIGEVHLPDQGAVTEHPHNGSWSWRRPGRGRREAGRTAGGDVFSPEVSSLHTAVHHWMKVWPLHHGANMMLTELTHVYNIKHWPRHVHFRSTNLQNKPSLPDV